MSVDATRLQDLCTYGLISISGPFQVYICFLTKWSLSESFHQITLAFISLYNLLGWSAFVGVAIMVFSIPLNTVIARFLKRVQETQMKNRDQRTRLMTELLANIRRYTTMSGFVLSLIVFSSQYQALCMGARVPSPNTLCKKWPRAQDDAQNCRLHRSSPGQLYASILTSFRR